MPPKRKASAKTAAGAKRTRTTDVPADPPTPAADVAAVPALVATPTAVTTAAKSAEGPVPEIDVVISFDATASMSSCIKEVRKQVSQLVSRLFTELAQLRIGVVAHGDYDGTYLMKQLDLTDQAGPIIEFINGTGDSPGYTTKEAYEYVLREVQKFSWRPAALRTLVMIGDQVPHEADDNPYNIDWKHELIELKKMNVAIYGVQVRQPESFYLKNQFNQIYWLNRIKIWRDLTLIVLPFWWVE